METLMVDQERVWLKGCIRKSSMGRYEVLGHPQARQRVDDCRHVAIKVFFCEVEVRLAS
jgi:hypothetical protein